MRLRPTPPVLALLALLSLSACKQELNTGLSEPEANEIVAVLLRAGIPAVRERDPKDRTSSVQVETSRFADAVELLRANGLPRPHHATLNDVFRGGGLVASPADERARMIYAMGEELSRTIADIDGVLDARVHIVLPDNDPLRRNAPPASASVFIRHAPGLEIAALVPQIKLLVSNGVAGLAYDHVSVVTVPAALPARPAAAAPELREVAGIWVSAESAGMLQTLLAAGAAAVLALLGLAGWSAWRLRGATGAGAGLVRR